MKNAVIIFACVITLAASAQLPVQTQNNIVNTEKKAHIRFDSVAHDFGKIKKDVPVTTNFTFTNTGAEPLIISNAHASCGCTTPHWPQQPVLPGQTGVIQAGFNAAHPGQFTKTITINSNADEPSVIVTIKGEVVEEPAAASVAPIH